MRRESWKPQRRNLCGFGWGLARRAPPVHLRADLEPKCIRVVCNLYSAHILYSFTFEVYHLSWKTKMWIASLKRGQRELEEALAFPLPPRSFSFLWHSEVCRWMGITFLVSLPIEYQDPSQFSAAPQVDLHGPAAWPISVSIRNFMVFYAPFPV